MKSREAIHFMTVLLQNRPKKMKSREALHFEKKRDNIYFHHYILIFGVDNINEVVNIYTSNKVIKWIASLDFIF
jgi:hypothetical protein